MRIVYGKTICKNRFYNRSNFDLALGATTLPASVAYIFLAIVLIDCTVMIILMETICKW